jgi:hypothetical protein
VIAIAQSSRISRSVHKGRKDTDTNDRSKDNDWMHACIGSRYQIRKIKPTKEIACFPPQKIVMKNHDEDESLI